MKTFKQHIIEKLEIAAHNRTSAQVLHFNQHYIPLNPKMFERLVGKQIRIGYHVFGVKNIKSLKKLEGTRKSISCFTSAGGTDMLKYGVVAGSGLVAMIEGKSLLWAGSDVFTEPDESGRRWINASVYFKWMKDDILKLKEALSLKHFKCDLCKLYSLPTPPQKQPGMKNYVKDFFDGIEDLLKKNINLMKSSFFSQDITSQYGSLYDELVLYDIKVLKLYAIMEVLKETKLDGRISKYDVFNEDEVMKVLKNVEGVKWPI
jgi:hypothetical protein